MCVSVRSQSTAAFTERKSKSTAGSSLGRWVVFIGAALASSEVVSRRLRDTSVESMMMITDANNTPLWHGDDGAPPPSPSGGLGLKKVARVPPNALGHNKP